jgi:hypothetical protein
MVEIINKFIGTSLMKLFLTQQSQFVISYYHPCNYANQISMIWVVQVRCKMIPILIVFVKEHKFEHLVC